MRLVEVQLVRWTDQFGVFHRYSSWRGNYNSIFDWTVSVTRNDFLVSSELHAQCSTDGGRLRQPATESGTSLSRSTTY